MKNIANIINFARGCEPRAEDDSYLYPTLKAELDLCRQYGFRSTVLLQYDALVKAEYPALVKSGYDVEVGLWLEVVQPLVEDAGMVWHGRFPWDWDIRVNFLSAYEPAERDKLIDKAFRTFKETFGYYPKVAGCWSIDAYSLAYIEKRYGLSAFCICKDQYGTDGITVWGGYYTGGYYPGRNNAIMPARTKENQIGIPLFRMLGPDIIDQYDLGLGSPLENQSVCSLEPVYKDGGGNPEWVDRFLRDTYGAGALSHAYAQFGQENSFDWKNIEAGLSMQLRKLQPLVNAGKVTLQTLGESGEWFKSAYALTPPNSAVADDMQRTARKTLWYYSRYYRVNILFENNRAWIRDLQLYTDDYAEPYLHKKNTDTRCGTFALPVMDGFRFSEGSVRAGIYPHAGDSPRFSVAQAAKNAMRALWGSVTFTADERALTVQCPDRRFYLSMRYAQVPTLPYDNVEHTVLRCTFRDFTDQAFSYTLRLSAGFFEKAADGIRIYPDESGKITFCFA
ncbi:MAG: hypothetical protein IJT41_03915 [Clostridia bacterium]|nr:hypothetical protein [Clostridia bacterium]